MRLLVRSQLIAGAAAMVGASTMAAIPAFTQHELQLPMLQVSPASPEVALAGFDSPLTELLGTLGVTNTYLFSDVAWQTYSPWSDLSALGVFPQIINDHLPIISELGLNGSDYLYQTGRGLGTSATLISEGVWNAAGEVFSLDIPGAITTLVTAVQAAGQEALDTGTYVLTGVLTRANAVFSAVAGLLPDIATAVVNQVRVLVGSVVKVVTDTVAALGSANPFENTWNAVVDGLFGKTGIPGVLNALTIGYGIDPVQPQIPTFVPSVRTVLTTVVRDVATALATPNPAPPPAAAQPSAPARSAAAIRSATAARSATAIDTPPVDSSPSSNPPSGADNGGSTNGDSGTGSGHHATSTGGSKRQHKSAE